MEKRKKLGILSLLCTLVLVVSLCHDSTIVWANNVVTTVNTLEIGKYVTEKEYVGDEVYITYTLPVNPYSALYGMKNDNVKFIGNSTNIHFEQTVQDDIVTVAGDVFVYNGDINTQYTNYSCYRQILYLQDDISHLISNYDDVVSLDKVTLNGVTYDIEIVSSTDYQVDFRLVGSNASKIGENNFSTYPFWFTIFNLNMLHSGNWTKCNVMMYVPTAGTYNIAVGGDVQTVITSYEYDYISANMLPLGYSAGTYNVIDIRDIKEKSQFDISFKYHNRINVDGLVGASNVIFQIHYLNEDLQQIMVDQVSQPISTLISPYEYEHDITVTVPVDASYMYVTVDVDSINVAECTLYDLSMENLDLKVALNALEENSNTMNQVSEKLDSLKGEAEKQTSLLGKISGAISNIGDTVEKAVTNVINKAFVPSEESVQEFFGNMAQIEEEHLAPVAQLRGAITEIEQTLLNPDYDATLSGDLAYVGGYLNRTLGNGVFVFPAFQLSLPNGDGNGKTMYTIWDEQLVDVGATLDEVHLGWIPSVTKTICVALLTWGFIIKILEWLAKMTDNPTFNQWADMLRTFQFDYKPSW